MAERNRSFPWMTAVSARSINPRFPWLTAAESDALFRVYAVVKEACGYEFRKTTSRELRYFRPRAVSCWLCKNVFDLSYGSIGRFFKQHHTTVMNAVGVIEVEMAKTPAAAAEIQWLAGQLREHRCKN